MLIKKKNIYSVPDAYFDQLPNRIQSRVLKRKSVFGFGFDWSHVWKIATPAIAVILIVLYFGPQLTRQTQSAEQILAQVSSEDLIAYLQTTDITEEEIVELVDFSDIDLDYYENGTIIHEMNENEIDALIDEYGIDNELL